MTKRFLLAGLLGGLAMFIWASLAHVVLPLGRMGIRMIPDETAALAALHAALGESRGFYIFPGVTEGPNMQQEYMQKLAVNPSGILIYHPPGYSPSAGGLLLTEFLSELVETLLAVVLLAQTRLVSYRSRVAFIVTVGLVAAVTTNISYWNWYGFPTPYTAVYMGTQLAGFLCAGLVAAAILKPAAKL